MTPQRVSRRIPRIAGGTPAAIGGAVLAAALLGGCGSAADQAQQLPQQAAAPEFFTQRAPIPATPPAPEASPAPAPAAESAAEESGTTAEPAAPRSEAPTSTRCHTSMLAGNLQRAEPGAGQRYAELALTNRSDLTCTLYGYGGIQLIGEDGTPLPTKTDRSPNPGPQLVRLAPGESATATLHWTAMPHEGEPTDGPCQPRPASAQIIPPDETDALTIPWNEGPVCGFGAIDNSAYHS